MSYRLILTVEGTVDQTEDLKQQIEDLAAKQDYLVTITPPEPSP